MSAEYPVVPVQQTGPDANRIDMVFLGDGYTAGQLSTTYTANVGGLVDYLFNGGLVTDPFGRYRNFFNIYQVNVASAQSGADDPATGTQVNTALNATYRFDGFTDRLLYISDTLGFNVMNAALAGTGITADMRFVAVNASQYGGGGGQFAVFAGNNPSSFDVALHEMGHSFAHLADQYDYNDGTTYSGPEFSEPDVTISPSGTKWAAWLGYDQPGIGVIGAYQGAHYSQFGAFRPSFNSKMRGLDQPFDAIGREAFVRGFYALVDPLDSYTPNGAQLLNPVALLATVIDPTVVLVRWLLNGNLIADAAPQLLSIEPLRLSPGLYTITVHAYDPTDWVRGDRSQLEQDVSWIINVTQPVTPGAVTVQAAGGLQLILPFDSTTRAATAQALLDPVNAAIAAGTAAVAIADGQASLPLVAAGAMLLHQGGATMVQPGYATLIDHASAPLTVTGGAADGQLVLAGQGGLSFNAWVGAGTVAAGGGQNLVSIYDGSGAQTILLGDGDDTVIALAASNTIDAGGGANRILLGGGANQVASRGADLIAGGLGTATITAFGNDPTVFLGPTASRFNGGAGHATVVAGPGADTIATGAGGTMLWLGSGASTVISAAADTVVGGTGPAFVTATTGSDLVFAGTGMLDFANGSGSSTILGNAGGTALLQGGSGSLIVVSYGPLDYVGGAGADTLAGFGGSLTVQGGSGGGVFLGGPAGGNRITAGAGNTIILGGGDGDVLSAGTGPGAYIQAGAGAETVTAAQSAGSSFFYGATVPGATTMMIGGPGSTSFLAGTGAATLVGGSGTDLFAFAAGRAPSVVIDDFDPLADFISLAGFPAGEAVAALLGASVVAGSQHLTLSDGTALVFQDLTGLTIARFL